jgi:hypothetical protein
MKIWMDISTAIDVWLGMDNLEGMLRIGRKGDLADAFIG